MGITPLVFEYQRDKFHPGNETKLHLAQLRFFLGRDRHNSPRTRCMHMVEVNGAAGKAFERIHAHNGQRFIDFHHGLLRGYFPQTEVHDMSDWIESWPNMDAFYDAYLSLCIRDCVLPESFRTEGCDRELTEGVSACVAAGTGTLRREAVDHGTGTGERAVGSVLVFVSGGGVAGGGGGASDLKPIWTRALRNDRHMAGVK